MNQQIKEASQGKQGRLSEKVVLVMGAGSCGPGFGNGRASAIQYAREGAKAVVCVDIVALAAEETAAYIEAEGYEALVVQADVTRPEHVAKLVAQTIAAFGRIDVLHNNVGVTAMGGPVEESLESWQHVMDTNITSMFLACKYVLPHMVERQRGAIINISSLAGIRVTPYPYSSYYASKAAVIHFTSHVALQYAKQGIRCNAIAPGLMNTPLIHQQIAGQYASTEEMIRARDAMSPTGKMGDGWDIAHAAVFLASDEAKFVNGVLLPVDGGQHALAR
jgi:NAD(P)-dependent dehydrogenase (short-subunit alcohol dehydrogenase family)